MKSEAFTWARRYRLAKRLSIWLAATILTALLTGLNGTFAQQPMQIAASAPGFQPTMTYQDFGKGENVNAFNGGLVVDHAAQVGLPRDLGGLLVPRRTYNSKSSERVWVPSAKDPYPPHGWAGFGWTLTFGRVSLQILPMCTGQVPPLVCEYLKQWYFEDESGARHQLYLKVLGGSDPFDGNETWDGNPSTVPHPKSNAWYVTNDGSYLRARYSADLSQWPEQGGTWTIYYPDGSTRTLGGDATSFLAPEMQVTSPTGQCVRNYSQDGWYTTSIRDRAGNTTTLMYWPYLPSTDPENHPYGGAQPYMGAIHTICNSYGTIQLNVYSGQNESDQLNGLLQSIQLLNASPTEIESYSYTLKSYIYILADVTYTRYYPELAEVTDPVGLQTRYDYAVPPYSYGELHPQLLNRIDYPTGASVAYVYGDWTYVYYVGPTSVSFDEEYGVTDRIESGAELGGSTCTNTAKWHWEHKYGQDDVISAPSVISDGVPVVYATTADPLGQNTTHFFSCPYGYGHPAGVEMALFTYAIGYSLNKSNPLANVVHSRKMVQDWGGGDAARCYEVTSYIDPGGVGPGGSVTVPPGNSRVKTTVEKEWNGGSSPTVLWTKTVNNRLWDGYGHYMLTHTSGTNLTGYWVSARAYDLKTGDSQPYQLDRQVLSFAGTAASIPSDTAPITVSGSFKVVQQEFTDAPPFTDAGLLYRGHELRNPVASFTLDPSSPATLYTPAATDPTATLGHLDSAGGASQGETSPL